MTEKQCTACKVSKPLADFYRATSSRDGLQSRCKTCEKSRATARTTRDRVLLSRADLFGAGSRDVFLQTVREQRRAAALVRTATSSSNYRGVSGGLLLWGYV